MTSTFKTPKTRRPTAGGAHAARRNHQVSDTERSVVVMVPNPQRIGGGDTHLAVSLPRLRWLED